MQPRQFQLRNTYCVLITRGVATSQDGAKGAIASLKFWTAIIKTLSKNCREDRRANYLFTLAILAPQK